MAHNTNPAYLAFNNHIQALANEYRMIPPRTAGDEVAMLWLAGVREPDIDFAFERMTDPKRRGSVNWGYMRTTAFCRRAEKNRMLAEMADD